MPLYLDTEFNGFKGELISLALASTDGDHFYAVLPPPRDVHPWVAEHVLPILASDPVDHDAFQGALWAYLQRHQGETIYADWPEDFAHLMQSLCLPGGIAPRLELQMRLIQSGPLSPANPHNALSDALALMEWHVDRLCEVVV